ncbi:PAS domain-containing protein [Halapricum sp. CBA1109]|uniref:ATP-binding protein n=1 Tax=Halapricum sp. CBA1109 TaxID=2668068 RepID=UPI0012FA7D2C|nr:ATP-binding protein [Halapricum sp. CBA1109]MUV89840.1 PAS domain-containing protein [Halapricum sp. CBA1109]
MTFATPTSTTYVKPLERDRTGITVLAAGVPADAREGIAAALTDRDDDAAVLDAPTASEVRDRVTDTTIDCVLVGEHLRETSVRDFFAALPEDGPPVVCYVDGGHSGLAADAVNAGAEGYFEHGEGGDHYAAVAHRIEAVAEEYAHVAELAETCRLLLCLTEYTDDSLWMFSGDWTETAVVNDAYESVWNRSITDLIEDPADFLRDIHPDDRPAIEEGMATLSAGESASIEYRIEYDDDAYHWLSVHAEPVFDEDGDVEYVAGFTRDVTDLKEREVGMRALNERSTVLLEAREREAVVEMALDIVEEVVDCSLAVVRGHRDDDEALAPLGATESALELVGATTVSDLGTVPAGTPLYDAFRQDSSTLIDDDDAITAAVGTNDAVGSLLVVPLGDHGVLGLGSPPGEQWGGFDRDMVELLGRTVTAALDRVERDEQLDAYRQRLEQSNENLQQFAYVASHDLQEPLRMVSSYVDLLESEYGDELDEEAEEYMHYAVDGAQRMKAMIDGLLAYSRVETQGESFERVDTTAVVENTLRELSLLLDENGTTVEYGDLPAVEGDETQIGQVFQNLLKNAAEHGDATTVEITATTTDDRVAVAVTDDGTGIPPEEQASIFDIFEQGHAAEDGSGIGLAVCDRIVERHDGTLTVDSAPGEGTTFTVTLPRALEEGQR